jgi:hypothetical protein
MLDISRFAKVLALAGSPADGEALAALRKARSMLTAAGMSFTDLANQLAHAQGGGARSPVRTLRRSRAEIAETVRAMLSDPDLSALSDREIARRTGLSPQCIGNWRRRLAREREARRARVHHGRRTARRAS